MKVRIITITVAVAAIAANAPLLNANPILELISGANTATVNAVSGVATFIGSIGGWTVNVTTGLAAPADGAPENSLDLNSTEFTAPGTAVPLEILWQASPYSAPGTYEASIGGTLGLGTTLSFTTFYGSTPLTAPLTFSTSPFSGSDYGIVPDSVSTPFTLTEEVTLSGGRAGANTSFDANLDFGVQSTGGNQAIPDGGTTVILLGGAVAGMGLIRTKTGGNK